MGDRGPSDAPPSPLPQAGGEKEGWCCPQADKPDLKQEQKHTQTACPALRDMPPSACGTGKDASHVLPK